MQFCKCFILFYFFWQTWSRYSSLRDKYIVSFCFLTLDDRLESAPIDGHKLILLNCRCKMHMKPPIICDSRPSYYASAEHCDLQKKNYDIFSPICVLFGLLATARTFLPSCNGKIIYCTTQRTTGELLFWPIIYGVMLA